MDEMSAKFRAMNGEVYVDEASGRLKVARRLIALTQQLLHFSQIDFI
jgi:hypothetical protein